MSRPAGRAGAGGAATPTRGGPPGPSEGGSRRRRVGPPGGPGRRTGVRACPLPESPEARRTSSAPPRPVPGRSWPWSAPPPLPSGHRLLSFAPVRLSLRLRFSPPRPGPRAPVRPWLRPARPRPSSRRPWLRPARPRRPLRGAGVGSVPLRPAGCVRHQSDADQQHQCDERCGGRHLRLLPHPPGGPLPRAQRAGCDRLAYLPPAEVVGQRLAVRVAVFGPLRHRLPADGFKILRDVRPQRAAARPAPCV